MAELLLSYLFPKFRGSKEDLVTLSLCHILESSEAVNEAFTNELCRRLQLDRLEAIRYKAQATGDNQERPDISGTDSANREMLICEAKFFAGLTDNQPNAYLERLIGRINTGLIFICPEARAISLWKQVTERINEYETIGDLCISIHGVHMSVISWSDLLGVLFEAARRRDQNILADLNQLEGLCKKIEDTDFLPFTDDDLSVSTARNIERYYMIVDDVAHAILGQKEFPATTKGLRATAVWGGYIRYLTVGGFSVGIGFSTSHWKAADSETTPFWFWSWSNDTAVRSAVSRLISDMPEWVLHKDQNGQTYLALTVPRYAYREEAVEILTDQVLKYIRILKDHYDTVMQSQNDLS